MKATLYKELSNRQSPIELLAGTSLKEALPDLDLDNAIIVVNNEIVNSDYITKENDIITIRLTPSGTDALIVTLVFGAILAIGAAIGGGELAYKAKQAAEQAEKELIKEQQILFWN